jgi:hypothetical protein
MKLSKFDDHSKKWLFISAFFLVLNSFVSVFLAPFCAADEWSVFQTINEQLNSGVDFVNAKIEYPGWPYNKISDEKLSTSRLQQKSKWSGIGFHALIDGSGFDLTLQFGQQSFSSSLIETNEWVQDGVSSSKCLFDGVEATNVGGFDSLLDGSENSQDAVFLPIELANSIADDANYESADDLLGENLALNATNGSFFQKKTLVIRGFYRILNHSLFYDGLFGNNFLLTSSSCFSSLVGSQLFVQFSSVLGNYQYRYSFFSYLKDTVIASGNALDFSITQNAIARKAIQKTQEQLSFFRQRYQPWFIACEIVWSLASLFLCVMMLAQWAVRASAKNWKTIVGVPFFTSLFAFWIFLGLLRAVATFSFSGFSIPAINRGSLAIIMYLSIFFSAFVALMCFLAFKGANQKIAYKRNKAN